MRELERPPEIEGDPRATEMIRVWLAHDDLHVSMLLGMWQDADEEEIDERDAWGLLLADVVRHIANGMSQSHGWKPEETIACVRAKFLEDLEDPERIIEGRYAE